MLQAPDRGARAQPGPFLAGVSQPAQYSRESGAYVMDLLIKLDERQRPTFARPTPRIKQ